MDRKKVTSLSAEIVMRYYDNDVSLFLDHLDNDVHWYGPAEGQFLQGKAAMVSAWSAEDNPLTFSVNDLRVDSVSSGPAVCIVILNFSVVTHYPSGNDLVIRQRIALTWAERTETGESGRRVRQPRILLCDITNPHPKSDEDMIYPVHFEQVVTGIAAVRDRGQRLHFTGLGNTEYYLFSDSVMWGSSCAQGRRSELHLTDGSVAEVAMSVRDICEAFPALFLRCHSSHFVNPSFVKGVRRFAVIMLGGTELPVPEKGYTAFRQKLKEFKK